MPREGEKLEELLSGFVDNRLTAVERLEVEAILQSDPVAQETVARLQEQSAELKRYGQTLQHNANLPSDFASHVALLALATAQSRRAANSTSKDSVRASVQLDRKVDRDRDSRQHSVGFSRWVAVGLIVSIAASLLLMVFLPKDFVESGSDGPIAKNSDALQNDLSADGQATQELVAQRDLGPTEPAHGVDEGLDAADGMARPQIATRPVGQMPSVMISYVLVVDVQIKREAYMNNALQEIFGGAQIRTAEPLKASGDVLAMLDELRMIVQPDDNNRPASMYVLRGDFERLDIALQTIWDDRSRFPNVSFNVAVDARAKLVQEIFRNLGNRAAVDGAFAVPVVVDQSQSGPAVPFSIPSFEKRYISSRQRQMGWNAASALGLPDGSTETVLLLCHVVE